MGPKIKLKEPFVEDEPNIYADQLQSSLEEKKLKYDQKKEAKYWNRSRKVDKYVKKRLYDTFTIKKNLNKKAKKGRQQILLTTWKSELTSPLYFMNLDEQNAVLQISQKNLSKIVYDLYGPQYSLKVDYTGQYMLGPLTGLFLVWQK